MSGDAVEFLKAEHRQVEADFQRLAAQPGDAETLRSVMAALAGHDAVERQLLYPLVEEKIPAVGAALAEHSIDGHEEVNALLLEIERSLEKGQEDDIAEPLARLMTAVRAHVAEEEDIVFPRLREVASNTDLVELGERMRAARAKAPTRPHSLMPRSGLAAKMAGSAAAVVDKVKDAVQH